MRREGEQADRRDVPGAEASPGRERVPRSPVSPLLNHLLDCREDSGGERSGDAGDEPLFAEDIFDQAALDHALSTGTSREDWYKQAGIMSRWDKTNVKMHELQPDPELAYWKGNLRWDIFEALAGANLIEDMEEGDEHGRET